MMAHKPKSSVVAKGKGANLSTLSWEAIALLPSKLLRRPTVCSPCYAFTCSYELQCLDISPEEVVASGLELLQE